MTARPAADEPADDPPQPPRRGLLDRVFRTSLILVPIGVLANVWWSWYATDHSVFANIASLPRKYLYLAVVLALVPWFTNALRLLVWIRFIGGRMRFRDTFRITLGGELASSVVPTASGVEVFRWGMMVQAGITKGQAASIVTLGYLEDFLFFGTAVPTAIVISGAWRLPLIRALGRELRGKAVVVALVAAFLLFAVWAVWKAVMIGRLGEGPQRRGLRWTARARLRLRKTWHDYREVQRMVLRRGKGRFALTFLITAVQWTSRYSVVTALAYFLAPERQVDPVLFFLLQWVIFTAMNFVPTPGASGGAEAAFVLVYSALLPARVIGIATAGWRMLTFYFQLTLGSILFTALNVADARKLAAARDNEEIGPGPTASRQGK
ncbi:MAG TPA: lysylphosphatidylglycerol synthase transmembrane domain-containing protein [Longimicrobium sp.]|nr:lysylphosphatidylglycerol synthase transmembrane domain-containing protein [Longimicrobium sp.]